MIPNPGEPDSGSEPRDESPDPSRPTVRATPEPLLPDRTRDETREGWGEPHDDNLDRLLAERPPHW